MSHIFPNFASIKHNILCFDVPASVWAKVLVLNAMVESGITQTELAKKMGTRKQDVQRIVNLHHATKIDTLSLALKSMGKQLTISAA